ncbi:MAG TPA: NnrS family protein [Kiritimatiellia bacterium]|nr:NnrS family protein [Kiritimatiellia bacterium]HMP00292.1 NnrS family protein [Kiritimatiellia bacterium]
MFVASYLRWRDVVEGEPYRLLFPFGAALGMAGVMLWPALVYGWIEVYPGILHARIMVQGFVFSFMAGFLLSALPHMLEVRGVSLGGTMLMMAFIAAIAGLHLYGNMVWADGLFAVAVAVLAVLGLRRWPERRDLPPPGFALAALGLASGFTGAAVLSVSAVGDIPPWWVVFAKLLLYHGMILFPVLGVGAYLLPRMVGISNRHLIAPKSSRPSRAWLARAGFMLMCGVVLIGSFALEASGQIRWAYGLRTVTVMACLLHEVPLFRSPGLRGSIPWALALSIISIFCGLAVIAIWPGRMMTYAHLLFISGYGLLILNIAARVMLGHSGYTDLIYARSRAANWITGLVLLAMATRVSADLIPSMMWSHYAYAALTWGVVTLIWLAVYGPLVAIKPKPEEGA